MTSIDAAVQFPGGNGAPVALRRIAKGLFALAVITIAVLSLVPGDLRPHTEFPGQWEHFAAYFGAGVLLSLGFRSARRRLLGCAGLAMISGLFELLQNFSPGRSPCICDALASSSGAAAGTIAGALLFALLAAHLRAAPSTVEGL